MLDLSGPLGPAIVFAIIIAAFFLSSVIGLRGTEYDRPKDAAILTGQMLGIVGLLVAVGIIGGLVTFLVPLFWHWIIGR